MAHYNLNKEEIVNDMGVLKELITSAVGHFVKKYDGIVLPNIQIVWSSEREEVNGMALGDEVVKFKVSVTSTIKP